MGTTAGVSHYSGGKWIAYTIRNGLSSNNVRAVYQDHEGHVWVSTLTGLSLLKEDHFVSVGGSEVKGIRVITEDRDGNLWIGTGGGGLLRYSRGRFSFYNARQGLISNLVLSILEDREGGLWVGTESGGLHRFYAASLTTYSSMDGLADDVIWSVTQDSSGDFWVGTNAGLSRYQRGHFRNYTMKEGLASNRVLSTYADSQGQIWIGTDAGLSVFRNGHFFNYGSQQGMNTEYALAIYEDREGDIWATIGNVLHQIRNGRVIRTYGAAGGLSHSALRAITQDQRGDLWVGSNGDGVFRLSQGSFTHYDTASGLPSDVVLSLYTDNDGEVWIGTDGSGIARYKNGHFAIAGTSSGLYDDVASQILEDDLGRLWIGSSRGIYQVDKTELDGLADGKRTAVQSVSYGTEEGMRSPVTNGGVQPGAWKARDGTLWFATPAGLARVDPHRVQKDLGPPPLVVEDVAINRRRMVPQGLLQLPPGENRLEFHYTAFNYNSPQQIRFRFRLQGFDKDWTDAGERRTAYYTNVPPGRYTFLVEAAHSDGPWSSTAPGIGLYLEPHFYQRRLFLGLCIFGVILAGSGAYRLRTRRLRSRARVLEQTVEERTRELRDYKERLEEQVAQRTAELSESNKQLRQEIAERQQGEKALRESEERFRALYEDTPSMYFTVDPSSTVLSVNQFGAAQLGYVPEELRGKSVLQVFAKEDQALAAKLLTECVANPGQVHHWELRKVDKNGGLMWVKETARAVVRQGGLVMLIVCEDITHRKNLEDQLRQAQKMEAVGKLAGGIAHDFNNLLTVIRGHTQMMLDRAQNEELRGDLERVAEAAARASSLTSQLLAFSRRQVLQPKVFNLNALVLNLEKMLRRLIGEDVEMVVAPAPDLGSVKADPGQIEQVIMNLVLNARDAMPKGGNLTVETANVDLDEAYAREHAAVRPGHYVMLAVSDTGVGMDPDTLAHVFEPFFTTKEMGKGTGLGLSTVYGIVKQSDGNIWVYSEPGRGTTFKIYFPRVDAPGESLTPEQRPAVGIRGNETILLVEDDYQVRELARAVLAACGYTVLAAENPSAVTSLCERHSGPIHLLLTDVVMPGLGGRELARQVLASRPGTKVLYMSGYMTNAIVHHGELDRGTFFLPKPFTPASLASKVRQVLDHSSATEEADDSM
ncbi:MAG TPA: two-component regulator propeller domain-containing protein [Candidatus Angelobacter sp.]